MPPVQAVLSDSPFNAQWSVSDGWHAGNEEKR